MNITPTLRLPYSRFLAGIASLFFVVLLAGCSGKSVAAPPPDAVEKRVQGNPNLAPAAQQAALQNMPAHQAGGRIRGQLMQRSLPQH